MKIYWISFEQREVYERSQESYQTETLKLRSDRDEALKETATLQSKLEESQVRKLDEKSCLIEYEVKLLQVLIRTPCIDYFLCLASVNC